MSGAFLSGTRSHKNWSWCRWSCQQQFIEYAGGNRCAYLLNRLTWGDKAATPDDYLYMATAGGAKVLGRDDIGYLAPGMAADFAQMDWNQLTYAGGCYDPVACIVESGDPRLVKNVVVNGELVVSSGKLTKVSEEEKRDYVNQVGKDLLTRASARIESLKEDIG